LFSGIVTIGLYQTRDPIHEVDAARTRQDVGMPPPSDGSREELTEERPLLGEGKTTPYQRVLARPDAVLHESPGGAALDEPVRPFDIFYAFARDGDWVEVAHAAEGPPSGWLPAARVVRWNRPIVAAFLSPAGRGRTLLFKDKEAVIDLLNSEDLVSDVPRLREQAVAGSLPEDSTVVSIEPETHVDIQEQFYILPILEHELTFNPLNYEELKLLEVASIPQSFEPTHEPPSRDEILRDFKVGVMFVMDATRSMGPYIDETRAAIEDLYRRIADSEIGERVSIGVVAFRDNTDLVPELEYVTKTFVELTPDQEPDLVLQGLAEVTPATVSSRGLNDDAFAGINDALAYTDWDDFGGRFVVLITDAGPRQSIDSAIADLADAATLNSQARERGIAIYVMHLRTPAGVGINDYAERQYRMLSRRLMAEPVIAITRSPTAARRRSAKASRSSPARSSRASSRPWTDGSWKRSRPPTPTLPRP
jgi:serine/threonine-protein kinase PpkA